MKRKIFYLAAVVVVAVIAAWNVNWSMSEATLSNVVLENIEALADESSIGKSYVSCSGSDIICLGTGRYKCCV
jgi:hypothetical protein